MEGYSYLPNMPYALPCPLMQNKAVPAMYQIPQAQNSMPGLEQYTYPKNLPEALKLLHEAVAGETEDRLFYQYLIQNAPSNEDKEIIAGIRDDEIGHFRLFGQVYSQLTGQPLSPPQNVTFEKPSSYCEGIRKAIRGEQNAVRKYRRILYALQDRVQMNILIGIITDELRHGILYNYLYSKNGCNI